MLKCSQKSINSDCLAEAWEPMEQEEIVEAVTDTAGRGESWYWHTQQELQSVKIFMQMWQCRALHEFSLQQKHTNLIIITFTSTFTFNWLSMSMIWLIASNCMDVANTASKTTLHSPNNSFN